jgi:hypothetical protein
MIQMEAAFCPVAPPPPVHPMYLANPTPPNDGLQGLG